VTVPYLGSTKFCPANYLQVEESEQLRLKLSRAKHQGRKQNPQMESEETSKEAIPNRKYFEEDIKEVQKSIEVETKLSRLEEASEEKQMEKRSLDKDVEVHADAYNWVSNVIS
jgi:hypothetical protein